MKLCVKTLKPIDTVMLKTKLNGTFAKQQREDDFLDTGLRMACACSGT